MYAEKAGAWKIYELKWPKKVGSRLDKPTEKVTGP
jgi:hypothetical protein